MGLLITLLIIVCIFGIVWWALSKIPIPPPFRWVVNVILAVIAIVVLLEYVAPGLHTRL